MGPWYEERPQRLERELESLRERGITYSIREDETGTGLLVLDLGYPVERLELDQVPVDGETIHLVAAFPDSFPYFRPEVEGKGFQLPRHQAPNEGNLCLLDRPTINWDPNQSLGAYLDDRLPVVLEQGYVTDPNELAETEGEQAEPHTDYYPYRSGAAVLIDPPPALAELTSETSGRLLLGFDAQPGLTIRAAVLEIRTESRETLWELDPRLAERYSTRMGARWVRQRDPPAVHTPISDISATHPGTFREPQTWRPVSGGWVEIVGVVIPEEVQPGVKGDGWLFVVRFRNRASGKVDGYYAPAMRIGKEYLSERVPELSPLREKTVAVVGLGCLGAPSALEFARAGIGELRLLDYDTVDSGTIVRWPLGLGAVGKPKVQALGEFVKREYPYTAVAPIQYKLGAIRDSTGDPEWEILRRFGKDADLIYDASAEWGVQHLLSQYAREAGIPYVAVAGRQGAWGGLVLRDLPDRPGCWTCYRWHLSDGTIPDPPADQSEAGTVQPAGCADPTFTGSSFDLSHVALQGVRLATATLCRDQSTGYPDFDWNVGILTLRTGPDLPVAPTWETYRLDPHPKCEVCQ